MRFVREMLCGLLLATSVGCDVETMAPEGPIADNFRCVNGAGAAIIALNEVDVTGTVDVTATDVGAIHGNTHVDLAGNVYVETDIYSGGDIDVHGKSHTILGEKVTGVDEVFAAVLYDEAEAAAEENNNDLLEVKQGKKMVSPVSNGQLRLSGQNRLTMPAGNYWFENGVAISGQTEVTLEGPVKIYTAGTVSISGTTSTNDGSPYPFEIISVSDDKVSLSGTSEAELHIYAPLSEVTLSGTTDFDGTILGYDVKLTGTAYIGATGDAINYAGGCVGEDDTPGDPGGGDDGNGGGDGPHDPDDHPDIPDSDHE